MLTLLAAAIAPSLGSSQSPLPLSVLKTAGIFLIFYSQGVLLPGEVLRKGMAQWKLHSLVQGYIFIAAPLLCALLLRLSRGTFDQPDLRMGFLFLSFLPTTISSAVGFTTLARGNVSAALFNCSVSALLGTFLVPLYGLIWLSGKQPGMAGSLSDTLRGIFFMLIFPLILGQLSRSKLAKTFARHQKAVTRFNSGVILFIVWTAFCGSFQDKIWSQLSQTDLFFCFAGVVLLLGCAGAILWKSSALLGLDRPSRITAFYCGSQKSLSIGLPLSALMFDTANSPVNLSLLVIPLLIYHPAQLLFSGWLVPKFQNRSLRSPLAVPGEERHGQASGETKNGL